MTETKLSRRRFIKTAAMVSVSALLCDWRALLAKPAKGSVIVVGAGMSGISTARELKSRGFHVTALEGRNRLGGRVWTDKTLGMPIDLGGSWIHGTDGNPMTALSKKIGLKTHVTDFGDTDVYGANGKLLTGSDAERFHDMMGKIQDKIESYEGNAADISTGDAIDAVFAKQKLSAKEKQFLNAHIANIEAVFAADINQLSVHAGEDKGFGEKDALFPNGYVQVVEYLANGLDIHYKQPVKVIDYSGKNVRVETAEKNYEADFVVVTVPLGVLKSGKISVKTFTGCMDPCHSATVKVPSTGIRFNPPLPDAKEKAIRRLGMGLLNKIALKFPVEMKDWPVKSHFVIYTAKTRGEFMGFLNMGKYGMGPVLVVFTGGTTAQALETQTDARAVTDVMKVLRTMFGKKLPEPSKRVIARWMKDPFAGGAYSYVRVGSKWSDYDALMQPLKNRVFFAGEATIKEFPGTVHGAFLSGVREAKRIAGL